MSGYNRTHIRGLYDYFGIGCIGGLEIRRTRSKSPKRNKSPPNNQKNNQNNEYLQNQKEVYSNDSNEVSYNEFDDDDYYSDDYYGYEEEFDEEESSFYNNRNLSSSSDKEENEDERVDFIICKMKKRLLDIYFNKWFKRLAFKETIKFQKNRRKKEQEKENPPKTYNTEDEYNLTNTADIQGDDSQKDKDDDEMNKKNEEIKKNDEKRKHRSKIVTIRSTLCYGKMVKGIRSVSFKEYCVKKTSKSKK